MWDDDNANFYSTHNITRHEIRRASP
jgi:hypothetical protein